MAKRAKNPPSRLQQPTPAKDWAVKGFISYAHDDIGLYREFRKHLAATERAFGIPFWADPSIRAGHQWEQSIQDAIEDARLFILLLSPAYLSSDYIREHELPAIFASANTLNGLICPVVLSPCGWASAIGSRQALPTRDGRLVPVVQWRPKGNGLDHARIQIEAAIRERFELESSTDWLIPLLEAREEQPGPVWIPGTDQFDLDPGGSDDDMLAAADRMTGQLHGLNRKKAASFARDIARLGNSLDRQWFDLVTAARDLSDVLNETAEDLTQQIAILWEASVRLASFLNLDKRYIETGSKDPDPLPPDIHRALDDLVGSVAPFARRFPSVRELDDERGAALANPSLFAPAVSLFAAAKAENLTSPDAAASMESMTQLAERGGVQADKARSYTIRGARGLISRSASYAAGFLAGAVASGYADQSPLIHRIGAFMARAEGTIGQLVADFPADLQHALGRMMRTAGKPGFPFVERTAAVSSPAPFAALRQPPPDFDLERVRAMILNGDVPPASWWPFITTLDFFDTPLKSLTPLANLIGLQVLGLSSTQVTDITPLANLTAMQRLYLTGTQVRNVAPLASLRALQHLELNLTLVSDVTPLAELTALEELGLNRTQVRNVTPLAHLTALKSLDLDGTQVIDVTPLANLIAIQVLGLGRTLVSDVGPLANLTVLQDLRLDGTPVSNAAPLANLTALHALYLNRTQVSDVTSLANLIGLERLGLNGTKVRDIAPLANLAALQYLHLDYTQVSNVAPLANLTSIQRLLLSGTQVTDVTPLANLSTLQHLDLNGTRVSDVTPLAGLTALQYLGLKDTRVKDVTALDRIAKLDIRF